MAQQYPDSASFIQENNGDPFLLAQGGIGPRMVQNPYAVGFTITERGQIDPAVELLFTRNINYTYDMEVIRRPNGDLGDYIAGFAEQGIPGDQVSDKMNKVYDAYIGMGGGRRRRRRTRRSKKMSRRRRRSLGR